MKVKELVAMLQGMDQEAFVFYQDDGGDLSSADQVYGFAPKEETVNPEDDEAEYENYPSTWHCRESNVDVKAGDKIVIFAPQF